MARMTHQPDQSVGRTAKRTAGGPRGTEIDMKIVADRVEEDPEVSAVITRLEAAADRELAAGTGTTNPCSNPPSPPSRPTALPCIDARRGRPSRRGSVTRNNAGDTWGGPLPSSD
jgi:hypothetical protein